MVIDGKAYGCIGLVVDNENCHVVDTVTVYPIVKFKLFDFDSSKLVDASIDEIKSYQRTSVYITDKSVFISYMDSNSGYVYKREIVTEPNRTTVSEDSPIVVYGLDDSIIFSPIRTSVYYYISDAITVKLDLAMFSYEFITGDEAIRINLSKGSSLDKYSCFLERYEWLEPESILDSVMDGVYLCVDTLLVCKNIDSLVIPSGIEYLTFYKDYLYIHELVCSSELHHIYEVRNLPEKLYLSKDTSIWLLCDILYVAVEGISGKISSTEYQEHRYSIGAMIGRGEYAKELEVYRSPDKKELLERALENTEIIVY